MNPKIMRNCVVWKDKNGYEKVIFFNENTGKLYSRKKIGTILDHNIDHPCVYLGRDNQGQHYVIHNHLLQFGTAAIDTWEGFSQGQPVTEDTRYCANEPMQRIANALDQVQKREPYRVVSYNCQTTVNLACNNVRKSETVSKWVEIGCIALVGFILVKAIKSAS